CSDDTSLTIPYCAALHKVVTHSSIRIADADSGSSLALSQSSDRIRGPHWGPSLGSLTGVPHWGLGSFYSRSNPLSNSVQKRKPVGCVADWAGLPLLHRRRFPWGHLDAHERSGVWDAQPGGRCEQPGACQCEEAEQTEDRLACRHVQCGERSHPQAGGHYTA